MTGESYLQMPRDKLMPELDILGGKPEWFMQHSDPPHQTYPGLQIDRSGTVHWVPRTPEFT
jgi:hypothetical protein